MLFWPYVLEEEVVEVVDGPVPGVGREREEDALPRIVGDYGHGVYGWRELMNSLKAVGQ